MSEMEFGDERLPAGFWAKTTINNETGCWQWTGSCDAKGYARAKFAGERRTQRLHRRSYEALVGAISPDLTIDHLCRVRNCINPAHLEPVTARENNLRGNSWSGVNARKTHCRQGHPYDAGNTYVSPRGFRSCRACMAQRRRAYASRRRADAATLHAQENIAPSRKEDAA